MEATEPQHVHIVPHLTVRGTFFCKEKRTAAEMTPQTSNETQVQGDALGHLMRTLHLASAGFSFM